MGKKFEGFEWILLGCCLILFAGFCIVKFRLDREEGAAEENNAVAETLCGDTREALIRQEQESYLQRQTVGTDLQQEKTGEQITQTETEESIQTLQEEPEIRILIKTVEFSGYYHEKLVLKGNSPLHLNGDMYVAGAQETVEITSDSAWFNNGCITVVPEKEEAGTSVENLKRAQGIPVYEGSFEIWQGSAGLVLVNILPLETYLKYVVPSEMPASYAQEALKAQAVCARTYAYRQILNAALSDYHAHVDDSVSYQVYNNTSRQSSTDEAVDATAGMILTCDGEPITAYFFSTSSGHTSSDEVWDESSDEKYLESVYLGEDQAPDISTEEAFASFITSRDEGSYEAEDGWYRWQVTLPSEELNKRLETYGIGSLESLEIVKRSDGGAVETMTAHGTAGDHTFSGEYEIREILSTKGYSVLKNDGTTTTEMSLMPSAYFICSPVEQDGILTGYRFIGGGYGHGVGMSQNGALHMAERGMNYEEILHFFYTDVELTDIRE